MAGNERCCCRPCGRAGLEPAWRRSTLPRSNRHLHHRLADACAPAIAKSRWGTGDIGFSEVNSASPSWKTRSRGARRPSQATSTVRASKAGFEPAFPWSEVSEIFTTSVLVEPRASGKPDYKQILSRRSEPRRNREPPWGSLCHRYPACASFPPAGPALSGTRHQARAPGSGSPVPACAGIFLDEPCFGQQKTLRSGWLGRVRVKRTVDLVYARSLP